MCITALLPKILNLLRNSLRLVELFTFVRSAHIELILGKHSPLTSVFVEFYSNFFGHSSGTTGSPVVDYYAPLAGKNVRPQSRSLLMLERRFE